MSALKVLLICPSGSDILARILLAGNCAVRTTNSFREACGHLSSDTNPVVICERSLPDGNWKDLLDKTPRLIVTSHAADEALWAEVLNLGGYDVLAQPFDEQEAIRVVAMAGRVLERPEHLLTSPIL